MEWTKLTSLSSAYEADLLAGRLRKAGIRARTTRSPDAPAAWLSAVGNPSGPIDVYVPVTEAKAARQLLRDVNSSTHTRSGTSSHRNIQLVGRGLIAISLIAVVGAVLFEALR